MLYSPLFRITGCYLSDNFLSDLKANSAVIEIRMFSTKALSS